MLLLRPPPLVVKVRVDGSQGALFVVVLRRPTHSTVVAAVLFVGSGGQSEALLELRRGVSVEVLAEEVHSHCNVGAADVLALLLLLLLLLLPALFWGRRGGGF